MLTIPVSPLPKQKHLLWLTQLLTPYQANCLAKISNLEKYQLSFLSINVGGLRNKLQIPEFVEFVSKYDILCFTETKLDGSDSMSTLLPG